MLTPSELDLLPTSPKSISPDHSLVKDFTQTSFQKNVIIRNREIAECVFYSSVT